MFVVWVACYTSVTMALFGATVYSFSDLHLSLGNTVGLFTGQYHQHNMEPVGHQGNMFAWRLVIISFLILALGSLTAYVSNSPVDSSPVVITVVTVMFRCVQMIAVLTWHYHTYKREVQPGFSVLETLTFYWHHLLTVCGCIHQAAPAPDDTAALPAVSTFFLIVKIRACIWNSTN